MKNKNTSKSLVRIPLTEGAKAFLLQHNEEPEIYFLGKLCKSKHDFQSTGLSIRRLKRPSDTHKHNKDSRSKTVCFQCLLDRNQPLHPMAKEYLQSISKQPDLYYLGTICPRKHDFWNTGKSLRIKSSETCLFCQAEYYRTSAKHNKYKDQPNYQTNQLWQNYLDYFAKASQGDSSTSSTESTPTSLVINYIGTPTMALKNLQKITPGTTDSIGFFTWEQLISPEPESVVCVVYAIGSVNTPDGNKTSATPIKYCSSQGEAIVLTTVLNSTLGQNDLYREYNT